MSLLKSEPLDDLELEAQEFVSYWRWLELNLGLLQEQHMILTTESPLQPSNLCFKDKYCQVIEQFAHFKQPTFSFVNFISCFPFFLFFLLLPFKNIVLSYVYVCVYV